MSDKLHMTYGRDITERFQRDQLAEILAQLTDEQMNTHRLMYPDGVKREDLEWALTQANNSLQKNLKAQQRELGEK